jgi:hypothetical protein
MPYGHEIVDEAAKRWLCVPEIRDHLVYFAEQGYVYGSHDLRWSHVLQDMNKKLFLCNLESLQEHPGLKCDKPTDTALSDAVYQQLLSLLRVASHEELNIKETFKWATDPSHLDEVASLVTNNNTLQDFFVGLKLGEVQTCLGSLFNDIMFHSLSPMAKAALYMLAYFRTASAASASNAQQDSVPVLPGLLQSNRTYHNSGKRQGDFVDHNPSKYVHSNTTD